MPMKKKHQLIDRAFPKVAAKYLIQTGQQFFSLKSLLTFVVKSSWKIIKFIWKYIENNYVWGKKK